MMNWKVYGLLIWYHKESVQQSEAEEIEVILDIYIKNSDLGELLGTCHQKTLMTVDLSGNHFAYVT